MTEYGAVNEHVLIKFGPMPGTGMPPQWFFAIEVGSTNVARMSGPRVLVLETLSRWVTLVEEESRPSHD